MKCNFCEKHFTNPNIYISHLNIHHGVSNTFTCTNGTCSRVFHRKDAFKQHLVSSHLSEVSEYPSCSSSKIPNDIDTAAPPNKIKYSLSNSDQINENIRLTEGIPDKLPTLNDFGNLLQSVIDKFISSLYNLLSLNRSLIQDVITTVSDIFSSGIISMFKDYILSSKNVDECDDISNILKNPFKNLNTEYKRLQYFENCNYLIRPIPFCIGTVEDPLRKNGLVSLSLKQRFGYFVPMRTQLSSFLEIPGVYKTMCQFRDKVLAEKTSSTCNIMQGDLWQKKLVKCGQKNIFPLIIYFDDFETNNPLGSHAGVYKQGAVYFSIPSLPPEYSSRLENIFLTMLFHSNDRQKFGNKSVFQILLNELVFLENCGIRISSANGEKEELVYFSLAVIAGDNLGLHSLYGLVESFSANYCCRFCKLHNSDMKVSITENENLIRKVEEYESFVRNQSYGVKEECVFHNLPDFHIYTNLTCDIMHDLPEGVHRYAMAFIIQNFISKSFFTLQDLNERIKYFNFGSEKNIPPPIREEHLKNGCIIQSAAEMMCLVFNFRLIVGDMIPEDDVVWEYYLLLLEITEIVYSTITSTPLIELLKTLIEEANYLYVTIFKLNLKPKFHFLLHYPRVMKQVGPLCYIQSIRFEAKHKEFKTNANVVSSRKNISFTLSLRIQLKFCHRLLSRKGLHETCSMGMPYQISEDDRLRAFMSHSKLICSSYNISWYEKNGTRFNNKSILVFDIHDFPQFCKVEHIIVSGENIFFLVSILKTLGFNSHLRSYEIELYENKYEIFAFCTFENCFPGILFVASDNKKYVTKF